MKKALYTLLCVLIALSVLSGTFACVASNFSTPVVKFGDKLDNDNEDSYTGSWESDPVGFNDISTAKVSGVVAKYYYGKAVTQTPTVTYNGETLKKDTDYTLSYKNNNAVGTATMIIKGKYPYSGEIKKNFYIKLAKPKVSVTNGTYSIKLSYNKVAGAKSYVIYQYNTAKKSYTRLAEVTALSYLIKGKAAGTNYYFLVRATDGTHGSPYTVSDIVKATTLCKTPAVKAGVSSKTVTLKISKSAGAKYYRVYKYNTSTKKFKVIKSKTTALTVKFTSQPKGNNYYLVRAFNANNAGSAYTMKNLTKAIVK